MSSGDASTVGAKSALSGASTIVVLGGLLADRSVSFDPVALKSVLLESVSLAGTGGVLVGMAQQEKAQHKDNHRNAADHAAKDDAVSALKLGNEQIRIGHYFPLKLYSGDGAIMSWPGFFPAHKWFSKTSAIAQTALLHCRQAVVLFLQKPRLLVPHQFQLSHQAP